MASIQDGHDDREIALDRVGVVNVVYPATVPERGGGVRSTEATFALFGELAEDARGTHLSRFVRVLQSDERILEPEHLERLLSSLRDALGSASASAEVEFTYFVPKVSPVSGEKSLLACEASYEATLGAGSTGGAGAAGFDVVLTVDVPVMTVCPCSLELTSGPAHTQRGHVAVSVRFNGQVWIEELVELAEDCASAPMFPILRGEDERAVLEAAYAKPVFIEDLVRCVAERLDSDVRVTWYRVEAENLESVHEHDVYACVERER
jgi:GTP cyclohydrolase I